MRAPYYPLPRPGGLVTYLTRGYTMYRLYKRTGRAWVLVAKSDYYYTLAEKAERIRKGGVQVSIRAEAWY